MHLGFRIRALTLATAGVVLAVAACGPASGGGGAGMAPPDKQILRVNDGTEPSTLDPTQQQWVYEGSVGRIMYEALVKAKADLSDVEGAAASSWDISSDGLTWTFHIRSGEKYSDGNPVVASDFVTSYKRILDPTVAAPYADPFFDGTIAGAQNYSNIDAKDSSAVSSFLAGLGVSAPDPKTFVVKLQNPAPWFKWVASLWLAAPIEKSDLAAGGSSFGAVAADAPTKMHGNGPFALSEVTPKDHITLVPNKYYRTQAHLQKVIYYEIEDANVEYANFQNGQLDMTEGVPPADVATVKNDPKLSKELKTASQLTTFWIDYNVTKKPLDNADLRLALSKSIDRNSLVQNIFKGVGVPFNQFIPKGMPSYEAIDTQAFDCNAAKQLLAKAKTEGVTDAQLNALHYEYRNSPTRKTTSEFIQAQWQSCLGINVTLDAKESKSVSHDLGTLNYQISGLSGWQADYPDPQDWFDIFITGSGNQFSGWSNSQYDADVKKGDTTAANSDRLAAYSDAQKILTQQAPVTFLYQSESFYLLSNKVQGQVFTPLDDYWYGDLASATTMYISQ
ncbi:MAG TPA: peptide ABC transporter substrate-binding protein [Candidatus Dormibacteraeota bacterium]|nr:peptide ABC transporter substrate-binding protein [Candidatus Dormibacteraeota bacterium]